MTKTGAAFALPPSPARLRRTSRASARQALVAVCLLLPIGVAAQYGTTNGEWRTWGGDLGVTRYAPLDQIDAANFNKLQVAWRFKTDNLGARPDFNMQTTPLMVGGVLYATAGEHRNAVALDARTGELLWMHRLEEGQRALRSARRLSGRGVGYWTDGKGDERVFYVTIGYQLVGLNAKDGVPLKDFGVNGVVDLKKDNDQAIDPIEGEVAWNGAPVVAKNVVIVGASHRAGTAPRSMKNTKGYVRGYDARTGKRLWIFHTIPQPGEFGNDTWLEKSWEYTGNTGVWTQLTVDENLGIAYLPIEQPTGDYFGGHRPGNNLFAESLVAVDLQTGKRIWHFQLVHHPIWDYDIPCAPMLVDITVDGKKIAAIAQPTKQGFTFVFDRKTGEPVWPIEERKVEQGTLAREWYSPTQPFPTRPPAFERNGFSEDMVIDFTPELKAEGLKILQDYKIGPIYTPPIAKGEGGKIGTMFIPNGANWPGGGFDPETGMMYVYSHSLLRVLSMANDPKRSDMAYISVGATLEDGGGGGVSVQGLPLIKPPYGRISAIDLNKGELVWQIAHGETPDAIKNNPALKGVNVPRTGRPAGAGGSSGGIGVLVTKTLIIAGEGGTVAMPDGSRGAMLRAYDKKTGVEAGAVAMPGAQTGSPMTYMLDGKQYIVRGVEQLDQAGRARRLPPAMSKCAAIVLAMLVVSGFLTTVALAKVVSRIDTYGGVTITTFTHSDIQLEYGGKVIHIDPWSVSDLSKAKPADLILITDDVGHHLDPKAIARIRKPGAPVVIAANGVKQLPDGIVMKNGETRDLAGIHVEATAAYDIKPGEPFHPKGEANGYIITLGGARVYVAGVTECVPEVRGAKNIDVAFFAINVPLERMEPAAAIECLSAMKPKVVYPYHYDQEWVRPVPAGGKRPQPTTRGLKELSDALGRQKIEVRLANWYSQ